MIKHANDNSFLLAYNHCESILFHRRPGVTECFPLQIVFLSYSPCLGMIADGPDLLVERLITGDHKDSSEESSEQTE